MGDIVRLHARSGELLLLLGLAENTMEANQKPCKRHDQHCVWIILEMCRKVVPNPKAEFAARADLNKYELLCLPTSMLPYV